MYRININSAKRGFNNSYWSNWDEKTFIKEFKNHYFYAEIDMQNLSYKILQDSAETINLITIKTLPTGHIYKDTTYHFWIFKNSDWYIKDWDVRKNVIENELPDSLYNSILEKIMKE